MIISQLFALNISNRYTYTLVLQDISLFLIEHFRYTSRFHSNFVFHRYLEN